MQSVQKVTPTMGQKEKIGKQERMKKKKKKKAVKKPKKGETIKYKKQVVNFWIKFNLKKMSITCWR